MISHRADLFKSLISPAEFTVKFIDNPSENTIHYVRTRPLDANHRYTDIDLKVADAMVRNCDFHFNGQILEYDLTPEENLNIVLGKIISVLSKIDRVKSVVGPEKSAHNIFFRITIR